MVKILESKAIEVVENSKPESEIDDKPESQSEVVAELVSQKEEISPQPMKVVELPIETLVDFPAEPSIDLVPTVAAIRTSFFLRAPDEYDPL